MKKDKDKKEKKPKIKSFILTLPLKTQPFQVNILNKRLEVGRKIYNSCLGELYLRDESMKRTVEYQEAIVLSKDDPTKSSKLSALRISFKISEYDLHSYIAPMKNHMASLDIHTAQKIATRCYEAFAEVMFGKAKQAHFKKYGTMESLEGKSNSTGIRFRIDRVKWNGLELPIRLKSSDEYAKEALTRKIKFCRILKKVVGGKDKFYVQLVLEGLPPIKMNKETGEAKHPIGSGRVGLDVGTQTIGIASETAVKLEELASGIEPIEAQIRRLNRALDRSRRAMNPDNYNADGTSKKGRRKWVRSNRYMKLLFEYKELWRVRSGRKNQLHNQLANFILSLGDEIYVEDMNFKALVKRAKKTEKNEKGKFKRKKRFGKSILRKSPSMLIGMIDQKLNYYNTEIHKVNTWSVKASQYCHLDDSYKKKPLSKRWNDFSDSGHGKIQRDLYSAFLIMCISADLQSINKELCDEKFNNFKQLHNIEVERLTKQNNLSSIGISKSVCFKIRCFEKSVKNYS